MAKDHSLMEDSNPSSNPTIHEVSNPSRRILLRGAAASGFLAPLAKVSAVGAAAASVAGCATLAGPVSTGPLLGFKGIPVGTDDTVRVPEGYEVQVLARWGDPVGLSGETPGFKPDASNTAAEQEAQFGMHHDGIHYYAIKGSEAGLLVMNHEYVDDGLLHRAFRHHQNLDPQAFGDPLADLPRLQGQSVQVVGDGVASDVVEGACERDVARRPADHRAPCPAPRWPPGRR